MKKIKLLRFNILVMIAVGLFAVLATGNLAFADSTSMSNGYQYDNMNMSMNVMNNSQQCGNVAYTMMDNMMYNATDSAGKSYSTYYTRAMVENGIMMEMGNGTVSCSSLSTVPTVNNVPTADDVPIDVAVNGGEVPGGQPSAPLPVPPQALNPPPTQFTITSWYQINR